MLGWTVLLHCSLKMLARLATMAGVLAVSSAAIVSTQYFKFMKTSKLIYQFLVRLINKAIVMEHILIELAKCKYIFVSVISRPLWIRLNVVGWWLF